MQIRHKQKGLALLVLVFILALAVIGYTIHALDSSGIQNERNKKTAIALAEAKTALLGSVMSTTDITSPSYLPNPDLAWPEGSESLAPLGGAADISLIGKFPWRSLGGSPLKDGWNECLWYAVSGRYKKTPSTSVFNWDTQGQIDVIDSNGGVVANNLAALIIAPASVLGAQNRFLVDAKYEQCGGNYDARNYLDTFNIVNAVGGEVNYFAGTPNNRQATDTLNKTFVLAKNAYYNDQFIFITVDDVFDSLVKRSDFVVKLNNALDSVPNDFSGLSVSPAKSADNLSFNCGGDVFCENWKEMLLFVKFPAPTEVIIDGMSNSCTGVVIFGGQRTGVQVRVTAAEKGSPDNYLEGINQAAFIDPDNVTFQGVSAFDGNNPSLDVIKCFP